MRKHAAAILVLVLTFSGICAQDVGLTVGFGMASQRMEDLKDLQQYVMDLEQVELGTVSAFPEYAMASAGLYYQLYPSIRIGAGYAFTSTGARSNYTDYTGEVSWDILASSHRLGAFLSYAALSGERYDLSVYGRVDANISRIDINRTIYILGYGDRSSSKFGAVSPSFSAGAEFLLHFNAFSFGLDGGYLLDMPGKLSNLESDQELTIPSDGGNKVITADWTGWRAQAKAIFWIGL